MAKELSVEEFGASTRIVDSETPNCEQQAVPAKSPRRKECDHVRSAFQFDKQSHVTKIVNVWRHNQLLLLSLNSRSTCFGSNGVAAEQLLLCCEPWLEDPRGKSVNISAKTVSELVRAKSSEIDIVR